MPVHSTIDEVIAHMKINLGSAETLTRGLSRQQFNWRPEPGRWSVAECIGHLNLINGADLKTLEAAVDAAREKGLTGEGPFQYGFVSRKFVNTMEPPITKKFKAPKQYVPPPDADIEGTIAEYRRISNELIRVAQKARGLDLRKVKTGLSGVPIVKMPLGARLSLLATHDTRHLWQADQVLKSARAAAAGA